METKIIKVTAEDVEVIKNAAEIIKNGGLVAFPTETVYGLGADGLNEKACQNIYEVKGRPSNKPLSLMVANQEMIDQIAVVTPLAEKLINEFLPGALTLILPKLKTVPAFVANSESTVGIRMPDNKIALELIRLAGRPIAAPSANISGQQPPVTAQEVFNNLNGKIPLILDGGECRFKVSSTIIDLTGGEIKILRSGAIDKEKLFKSIGEN